MGVHFKCPPSTAVCYRHRAWCRRHDRCDRDCGVAAVSRRRDGERTDGWEERDEKCIRNASGTHGFLARGSLTWAEVKEVYLQKAMHSLYRARIPGKEKNHQGLLLQASKNNNSVIRWDERGGGKTKARVQQEEGVN